MAYFKMFKKAAIENLVIKLLWLAFFILLVAGVSILLKNFING